MSNRQRPGSVFQRADGKWVAQVSIGPRGQRRYHRRIAATEQEARSRLAELPTQFPTPAERFEAFIDRSALGCWEWGGNRNHHGYGLFRVGTETVTASRFAYQAFVGAIPDGMHVLHRCDNPPCVRPDHLFVGTHSDNMRDMVAKGRRQ